MYYLFERAECPASTVHTKERRQDENGCVRLKHDFKKVGGLRALMNMLVQEALDSTAKKTNRDKAIDNALRPFVSDKVRLNELKRFAKGESLLPRQYSALFAVIGGMVRQDSLPLVWRMDIPADPQKNFYSVKPADLLAAEQAEARQQAAAQPPLILDDDPAWLKRAILASARANGPQ